MSALQGKVVLLTGAKGLVARSALVALACLACGEAFVRLNLDKLKRYDARQSYLRTVKYLLYPTIPTPDLCFIGTSRTDCAFKSDWFRGADVGGVAARDIFNFGIEYGVINEWITVRYIVRTKKVPKVAVFEVTPCAFNGNYSSPYFEHLPFTDGLRFNRLNRNPEEAWQWLVGWAEHGLLERASLLYDYRQALEYYLHESFFSLLPRGLAQRGKSWKQQLGRPPDGYGGDGDGYRVARTNFAALSDPAFDRIYPSCRDFRMDRPRERFFEDAVDSLRGAGARVILLDIPVTEAMERVNYNEVMRRGYADYVDGVARGRGLLFLSPSRESCGLTDADYLDMSHLSREGGRKFSACVRALLTAKK